MKIAGKKRVKKPMQTRGIWQYLVCGLPLFFISLLGICGCSAGGTSQRQGTIYGNLAVGYEQTELRRSNSLEVLKNFRELESKQQKSSPDSFFITQSDTVVASAGQAKKGYQTWFTMVAFDEQTMTATRKYFYMVDERVGVPLTHPMRLLLEPKQGLAFDCRMLLPAEVLSNPSASSQSIQLAILRQVARNFRRDINTLEDSGGTNESSQALVVPGMLMNQVFEAVLLELSKSPILAMRLSRLAGVEFNHITFDKGRICMVVDNDTVTVKIRLGLFRHEFEHAE